METSLTHTQMDDGLYKFLDPDGLKRTLQLATRKWCCPTEYPDPFEHEINLKWQYNAADINWAYIEKVKPIFFDDQPIPASLPKAVIKLLLYLKEHIAKEDAQRYLNQLHHNLGNKELMTTEEADAYVAEFNTHLKKISIDRSVYSLTERYDDLAMWSTYANFHTGGVVKFVNGENITDESIYNAQRVVYSDNLATFQIADIINDNSLEQQTKILRGHDLTKSLNFAHEHEWRILKTFKQPWNGKPYEFLEFDRKEIAAVYLGCNMAEKLKRQLGDIILDRYPWAEVYQAKPEIARFGLKFDRIK